MSDDDKSGLQSYFVGIVILLVAYLVALFVVGLQVRAFNKQVSAVAADWNRVEKNLSKPPGPAPTPAACCKADDCKQELAQVDARFGDVWDELVEVQEQLAKVKGRDCGPVKECSCDLSSACKCEPSKPCQCDPAKACACSDKPACECKPAQKPAVNSQVPVRRVFKRCK